MSDLEQQAASWVPPWQRAGAPSTPDTDAPNADPATADAPDAASASPEASAAEGALAEVALPELDDIDEEIPTDEPWCEVDEDDSGSFADSLASTSGAPGGLAEAEPHQILKDSGRYSGQNSSRSTAEPETEREAPLGDLADGAPREGGPTAAERAQGEGAASGAQANGAAEANAGDEDGGPHTASEAGGVGGVAEASAGGEVGGAGGEASGGASASGAASAVAERAEAVGKAKAKAAKRMAAAKAALAAEDEASQAMVPGQRESGEDGIAALTPLPGLAAHEIAPALEAILMVVDEPVSEILLAQVLEIPAEDVAGTLIDLSASYTRDGKGFDLRRAAGGWRFYTRADYSAYVERFVLDGQQLRLTQASLETLAVVAYKQPVTRSRISAIRGVNVDGVVRTLVTRGMVEECGADPDSGAHLYRTTSLFLEKLGLDSVEQLPPLAPFLPDNLDEVEAP